jgi:hypothetical protein
VAAVNRGQMQSDVRGEHIHRADKQAAKRRERLREAEDFFPLITIRK